MLVVTCHPGQSVLIGPDIEVFVFRTEGKEVRVGIDAPRTIRVLRRELLAQVEGENPRPVESPGGPDDFHRLAHRPSPGKETP